MQDSRRLGMSTRALNEIKSREDKSCEVYFHKFQLVKVQFLKFHTSLYTFYA